MSITLRGGVWHCHFFTPAGKRVRRSLGTADKKQALELHDKLKAEAWRVDEIGDLLTRTFEDACLRWLDEKEHKRSLDDDKVKMEFFVGHFSGRDISTITGEEIQKIVSKMVNRNHRRKWEVQRDAALRDGKPVPDFKDKPVSAGTRSHYLSFMRSLLRAAANEWGWIKRHRLSKRRSRSAKGYAG